MCHKLVILYLRTMHGTRSLLLHDISDAPDQAHIPLAPLANAFVNNDARHALTSCRIRFAEPSSHKPSHNDKIADAAVKAVSALHRY